MSLPLAGLRSIQLAYLTDRADILRYAETNTPDGTGQTWSTVATAVPCRVSQPGATASERTGDGGALRAVSDWRVWLPYGQDVTERDRIAVIDGRTFEVERVDETTNETARRCLVTLVG